MTEKKIKVALVSLGCSRTLVDSEVALGGLVRQGYRVVADVKNADVAIVNTCGFIEEAKAESIETILELCEMKKKRRSRRRRGAGVPRPAPCRGDPERDPRSGRRHRHK